MHWQVKFVPKAEKALGKCPKEVIRRVLDKLELVKKEPFAYLEHYEGEGYKLRIGDYRALVDVDFDKKLVKIRVFDKRGRIYNR